MKYKINKYKIKKIKKINKKKKKVKRNMYVSSISHHLHFKVFIVNVCVLEYIVCMANINNFLFSINFSI